MLKNSKVLVTGGAGFIGSHIVDELVKNNNKVIVIDNFSNGRLFNLINNIKDIKIYWNDIRNIDIVDKACEEVDYVIHQGALANVTESIKSPEKYFSINVLGTRNILHSALKNNVKKIVLASSSAVEYLTSPYAYNKKNNENDTLSYIKNFNFPIVALRYYNVYGARQKVKTDGAVIPNFMNKILSNDFPFIYGDGTQKRDFVYVKDVVNANLYALTSNNIGIYSVGFGTAYSINYLCNTIKKLAFKNMKTVYMEARKGDVKLSQSNCREYLTNWKPKFNLKKGLKETIKYYKETIKC